MYLCHWFTTIKFIYSETAQKTHHSIPAIAYIWLDNGVSQLVIRSGTTTIHRI